MTGGSLRVESGSDLEVHARVLAHLTERIPFRWLPQTCGSVGGYLALSLLGWAADSWWIYPILWPLQGFLLACFLGAAHDCGHGTFATHRTANRIAGTLWSTPLLFNFTIYKYYHLEHHSHTTVEGDTEPLGAFDGVGGYLSALPMLGFYSSFWRMALEALRGRFPHFVRTRPARREALQDSFHLSVFLLGVTFLTSLYPRQVVALYWGPLVICFPMIFLTSIPEHYGCVEGDDPRRNTRSLTSNRFYRFLFWNGNYHAEHHSYPGVPSYELPTLHRLIGNAFEFREASYVAFHLKLLLGLTRSSRRGSTQMSALKRVEYVLEKESDHNGDSRSPLAR